MQQISHLHTDTHTPAGGVVRGRAYVSNVVGGYEGGRGGRERAGEG